MSKNLIGILTIATIQSLSTPSNFRYGEAIYSRGGVEFIENTPTRVGGLDGSVAEGGSQRRRTTLAIADNTLTWNCTGNPKKHQIFCKHCVALALTIRNA